MSLRLLCLTGWSLVMLLCFSAYVMSQEKNKEKPKDKATSPIKAFEPVKAKELDKVDEWINSEPLSMKELKGRVVVVHFWTFGCINCLNNLPHYKKWQKQFAGKDITIIGIHTPETEAEKKPENVRSNIKTLGITYPVAIDGTGHLWNRWNVRMWPTVGLIDKKGYIRYYWEGEMNWKGEKGEEFMRGKIKALLEEQVAE